MRAQDRAVAQADPRAGVIAFSDANSLWEPAALRPLVARLAEPGVGYVCGQVRFESADGDTNQEGLYWRYEMWLRARESQLASVTGGNGAIYAVRREDYYRLATRFEVLSHVVDRLMAAESAGVRYDAAYYRRVLGEPAPDVN